MTEFAMLHGKQSSVTESGFSSDWEASSSQYGHYTYSSPGNVKKWTFSTWFRVESFGATRSLFRRNFDSNNGSGVILTSTQHLAQFDFQGGEYWSRVSDNTTINTATWYHGVVAYDTDQVTASNRVQIYLDNVLATTFEFETYPAQGYRGFLSNARQHFLSRRGDANSEHYDGLLFETYFVDGLKLTPGDFGQDVDGTWYPKTYTGAYGTTGFRLSYQDSANLLNDHSGNGHNFTPVGGPIRSSTTPP